MRAYLIAALIPLLLLVLVSVALAAGTTVAPIARPPLGHRWFGITMQGERTGFSRQTISETSDGYEIYCEGSVRMVVLGFSREASSHERYFVKRDLSLRRFEVEQTIDGSPMKLNGEVTAKGIRVVVESGGAKKEKLLKTKGEVFPPPAMNLYPLMKGAAAGKSYRAQMLDVEGVKVRDVKMTVRGLETLPGGTRTVRMQNDLYPMVDNDIWVDLAGNTVKESVRDGLVETVAEDELTVKRFITEAALSRRDLILDFSLVRVDQPLKNPSALKRLVLEVDGIPSQMPLIQGGGQEARRLDGGKVLFTVEPGRPDGRTPEQGELKRLLEATDRLPVDHPEIMARKSEVLGDEREPRRVVERLVRWVAEYVEDTVTDSQSPLDTLKSLKGNCQSHARLYASLARAAGVPTRFVSGLVYAEGKGFLYHSWAESLIGSDWVQVDPTFDQVPADATHVKLVEGEGPDEMAAIAGVVGRIRARVVEQR